MAVNKKTGNMTSPVQMETQQLFGLTVKWSHLLKPDMVYDSGHSVTVEMTDELEKLHKELKAQTGLKKVNGVKVNDEGTKLVKFGTKIFSNDGVERFPKIYDKEGQATDDCPYGGDKVNVAIKPKVVDKTTPPSISCYLQEVQWVEKNNSNSVTFEKPKEESSFSGKSSDSKTEDEGLPF
jgi:hypothetical protein|tara:strand:+ start:3782 stop:4321 length:540 start_codon:yes stop_codon:yes gene_type:complete